MDEEEVQYEGEEEEEAVEGEEEEEINEEFERADNAVGGAGDICEKTLYDEEGNEINFTFDKIYMVRFKDTTQYVHTIYLLHLHFAISYKYNFPLP